MSTCASCERELRPEWKFCVWCGAEVTEHIPAAIRPEAGAKPKRVPTAMNTLAPLIFAITCFAIAAVIIAWLAINVWT